MFNQKKVCKVELGILWGITILLGLGLTAIEADASVAFYDDFEDGDTSGWLESWQQGRWNEAYGSWGVVSHNGSNMARIEHTTDGFHSLAHDFTYVSDNILSFDMQIGGKMDGGNHAGGNVTLSFLNKFNVKLGSVTLGYSTYTGTYDPAHRIDSDPHHYSASMTEWADFAGLSTTDNISTLSLSFVAWGAQDSWLQAGSTGTIWFDNVNVTPEPTALSLFALGAILAGRKRRK